MRMPIALEDCTGPWLLRGKIRRTPEEAANSSPRCGQGGNPEKRLVVFVSQAQGSRRDVLLEMFDRGSPWDGQHNGGSMQQPGQRNLRWAGTVCPGDSVKHFAGNFTGSQREPGNKSNSIALTIVHYIVPFAVRKAIAVLHGDDGDDFARPLDVFLRNVGQCDQANLAFVSQLSQSFYRCPKRYDGIRNMQLINVDAVQAQSFQASLNRLAKVRRSCIVGPLIRTGTVPASLGRNHQASRVGEQRFGNQFL